MFCPKCGAQLPDGARFCSKCGTTLGTSQPVAKAPATRRTIDASAILAQIVPNLPAIALAVLIICLPLGWITFDASRFGSTLASFKAPLLSDFSSSNAADRAFYSSDLDTLFSIIGSASVGSFSLPALLGMGISLLQTLIGHLNDMTPYLKDYIPQVCAFFAAIALCVLWVVAVISTVLTLLDWFRMRADATARQSSRLSRPLVAPVLDGLTALLTIAAIMVANSAIASALTAGIDLNSAQPIDLGDSFYIDVAGNQYCALMSHILTVTPACWIVLIVSVALIVWHVMQHRKENVTPSPIAR